MHVLGKQPVAPPHGCRRGRDTRRRCCVVVAAAADEALCRDKVSAPKDLRGESGTTCVVNFKGADGRVLPVEMPEVCVCVWRVLLARGRHHAACIADWPRRSPISVATLTSRLSPALCVLAATHRTCTSSTPQRRPASTCQPRVGAASAGASPLACALYSNGVSQRACAALLGCCRACVGRVTSGKVDQSDVRGRTCLCVTGVHTDEGLRLTGGRPVVCVGAGAGGPGLCAAVHVPPGAGGGGYHRGPVRLGQREHVQLEGGHLLHGRAGAAVEGRCEGAQGLR